MADKKENSSLIGQHKRLAMGDKVTSMKKGGKVDCMKKGGKVKKKEK